MNYAKALHAFTLMISISPVCALGPKTFFIPRSQAVNAVRELVGWQQEIHKGGQDTYYGTVSGTIEYSRSFRADKIAHYLFGANHVTFSGSQVPDRGSQDILADYFGLPFCFKSVICFDPVISNVVFDFDWYQGFDSCIPGLYLIMHLPVVESKADLHPHETVMSGIDDYCAENTFYPAGYMADFRVDRDQMYTTALDSFIGKKVVGQRDPLRYGRIFGREVRSRIAELQLTLGYTFLQADWYHCGLGLRVCLPTGNRPDMEFLFDATVGNGHHWECGGQLTSHVALWQSDTKRHRVALYLDANITHLFADTQYRSYDLVGHGDGSRYMLLQEFGSPSTNLQLGASGPIAETQFTGHLLPAINVTTLPTTIHIAAQADVVLKCAYQRDDGFEFDIGYNFYGRSKETSSCRTKLPEGRYAIKGDAQVYGFDADQNPVRLSVSQSKATVFAAATPSNILGTSPYTNANADTPTQAFDGSGVALNQLNSTDAAALAISQAPINTSAKIKFLQDSDINECSALVPYAISHTVFAHANKSWSAIAESVYPYLGAGISVELGGHTLADNSALSQWRLWIKGGISY